MRAVPDMPRRIKAALVLADHAIVLRSIGRQCEDADAVFRKTPPHQTRSATMMVVLDGNYRDALAKFDELAEEYIAATVAELDTKTPPD